MSRSPVAVVAATEGKVDLVWSRSPDRMSPRGNGKLDVERRDGKGSWVPWVVVAGRSDRERGRERRKEVAGSSDPRIQTEPDRASVPKGQPKSKSSLER